MGLIFISQPRAHSEDNTPNRESAVRASWAITGGAMIGECLSMRKSGIIFWLRRVKFVYRGASGERRTSSVGNKWRISKEHGTWRCFQRLCKFWNWKGCFCWFALIWKRLLVWLCRIAGSARLTLTKIRVIWWRQATMTPFVSTMLLPLRELIYIYIPQLLTWLVWLVGVEWVCIITVFFLVIMCD